MPLPQILGKGGVVGEQGKAAETLFQQQRRHNPHMSRIGRNVAENIIAGAGDFAGLAQGRQQQDLIGLGVGGHAQHFVGATAAIDDFDAAILDQPLGGRPGGVPIALAIPHNQLQMAVVGGPLPVDVQYRPLDDPLHRNAVAGPVSGQGMHRPDAVGSFALSATGQG